MDRKKPVPTLLIHPGENVKVGKNRWYWRFVAANDQVKADGGEPYSTAAAAEKAARSTLLPPYMIVRRYQPLGHVDANSEVKCVVAPYEIIESDNPRNFPEIETRNWS